MMVKRKLDCSEDESLADRQIHKSGAIVHNLRKIWRLHLEEPGLAAGWQSKFERDLTF